jgi:chemotaxis family two-component system response regulator Rcp1
MGASGSNPNPEQGRFFSLSRSETTARRPQILIAEDNKTDVFPIRDALDSAQVDADIHVVSDGDAAIQFLDAAAASEGTPCPALMLLDINLPKKTGDEVLRHLRRGGQCEHTRVLIVTSSDAPGDRQAVAGHDIAGYFKKPSEYAAFMKLRPIVKALLETWRNSSN